MRVASSHLKTVLYNVLVFFVFANVLYWLIPTVGTILRQAKNLITVARPPSPAYSDAEAAWVRTYQRELQRVGFHYRSHIGWRGDALVWGGVLLGHLLWSK